jgi:hypothetical protein
LMAVLGTSSVTPDFPTIVRELGISSVLTGAGSGKIDPSYYVVHKGPTRSHDKPSALSNSKELTADS